MPNAEEPRPRVACDSMVALPAATADGAALLAKNSDRPADEAQPLVHVLRRRHDAASRLRCQYIEIDQVAETAAVIGSRPFWLWGFEHGLNEHGVAIGNHTVFSRDPVEGKGLIGMDLVRLGLERAKTAAEAVEIIAGLVERFGQGGSGYFDKDWAYHNSFLIGDRCSAFLLETSDRLWAVRRIETTGSASNHLTIGSDWEALSPGTIEHAVDRGWWAEDAGGRFDFSGAFRDTSMAPEIISSGRHRQTCAALARQRGRLTVPLLRAALRDHYDSGALYRRQYTPDDERYYGVCMHADPVGTTTASMIAHLPPGEDAVTTYWGSLGSPCVGVFLPFYLDGGVPEVLGRGGERPSSDSPWWGFKRLLGTVEKDPQRAGAVRARWDALEARLDIEAVEVEERARDLRRRGHSERAAAELRQLSERAVAEALGELGRMLEG